MRVARLSAVASLLALLCLSSLVAAQVTTSTVRGVVNGADDGVPMAGVEVTLVNTSTGAVKTTTTNESGEFAFSGVPIGGPYHIKAELMGFRAAEEKDVILSSNRTHNVALGLKLQEEVIEISGTSVTRNTSNRTVVTAAEIDILPSVARDPRDVVRRNPEVSVEGSNRTLSIGGANNRYNSITIDGTRQDDDFGLNASGYPTRRSPIGLSAVQEVSVDSSPFDVHYGKFLGGNVNIVTKSGTNEFKGSLVGTYTSDSLLGSRTREDRINVDYSELRYGATVGGPIIKDKVHFLASIEGLNATTPIDNGPMDSTASNKFDRVTTAQMMDAIRIARDVYNFEAGVASRSGEEGDLKLLGKIDWRINPQHRASVIYQRTRGNNIQIGGSNARSGTLPLSSNWYDATDTLNMFAARAYSDWSEQLSTQAEVTAKLVSSRVPSLNGNGFMSAVIFTPEGGAVTLGPDISRHSNLLDNDVFHARAEANYLLSTHLLTAGVDYELTRIRNLFVQRSAGEAIYANMADFEAMRPQSLRYQNSITLDPLDAAANWNVGLWTGYIQDQIKLTNQLTLFAGARAEMYQTNDRSPVNANFVERYGFANNASLNGRKALLPRLGVTWLPVENLNVRAGAGLYSGGTPAVWVSNNYTNDGTRTFDLTCTNGPMPIISATCPDPSVIVGFNGRDIPDAMENALMANAGNGNVDALDPDFKVPSVWKIGAGGDYQLDIPELGSALNGIELRANYTYTKVRRSVNWIDLRRDLATLPNNVPVGETIDGRPFYAANFNPTRGFDMMLTNDSRGYGHVASMVVQKGFPFGLFVAGSYAYTNNHEVSPGTSSVATSNYGIVAVIDPQRPDLAVSNYERRHRLTGVLEYSDTLVGKMTDAVPWRNMKTSFGMFIESRSGQPYSWTFGGGGANLARIFGEEQTMSGRGRSLFYVPTDERTCTAAGPDCDVVLSGITKEDFNSFLDKSGLANHRGQIAPRNGFKSPRFHRFDLRIAQDLPNPLSGQRARFVVDLENVGNLLHHKWGRLQQVPFPYYSSAVDVAIDRATGTYIYTNLRSYNPTRPDTLQSVWRVSLGLMYDF